MRYPRGKYCGTEVKQHWCDRVWFTLSKYRLGHVYADHVHADPGLFVLLSGQHRETRGARVLEQKPFSVFEYDDGHHSTAVGPEGMVGLNISFQREWFKSEGLRFDRFCTDSPLVRRQCLQLLPSLAIGDKVGLENGAIEIMSLIADSGSAAVHNGVLAKMRQRIEADFRTVVRIGHLSEELGYHPVYLARVFREVYGCSMTEYLKVLRISEAVRMILEGRSAGEAALDAGFYDQPHFCRAYSEVLHSSPKQLKDLRARILRGQDSSLIIADC